MDTEKCRVFLSILEEGSLSRAAERLGYTPSGVSRMMDSMEEETGFILLHRHRQGVSLTNEGEEMLSLISEVARQGALYEQTARRIQGLDVGHVVMGTAYFAFYPWLSTLIAGFHEVFPHITVELCEAPSSELARRLADHSLDIALASQREGRHRFVRIVKDPLVALLPPDHPCAHHSSFPAIRLREDSFIDLLPGVATDNALYLREHGILPNTLFSTPDSISASAMVAAGLGVTTTNRIVAKGLGDRVVILPLSPAGYVEIGLLYPREEDISPAAARFAEYALAHLSECRL